MNNERNTESLINQRTTELLQELINCALSCEACTASCLSENDVTAMAVCIELSRDCADLCYQASRFAMRNSEILEPYLQMVEEVCRMCADECNKHQEEHCKICAESCERCADVCDGYLKDNMRIID